VIRCGHRWRPGGQTERSSDRAIARARLHLPSLHLPVKFKGWSSHFRDRGDSALIWRTCGFRPRCGTTSKSTSMRRSLRARASRCWALAILASALELALSSSEALAGCSHHWIEPTALASQARFSLVLEIGNGVLEPGRKLRSPASPLTPCAAGRCSEAPAAPQTPVSAQLPRVDLVCPLGQDPHLAPQTPERIAIRRPTSHHGPYLPSLERPPRAD
jgi:hypothetical protein